MSWPAIRAVVFDAVGTLMHPRPPVAAAYAEAARRFGCDMDEFVVRQRFRRAFAQQEEHDQRAGNCTSPKRERQRWWIIVQEVFPEVEDSEGLFGVLWDHFAQPGHWALFDDAAAAWQALRARGLRLAVASNFDSRLSSICRGLPPLDAMTQIFVSSELGMRKPGGPFFDAVAAAMGLAAGEILMVGDDLENDYRGARNAGWQAVLVRREATQGATVDVPDSLASLVDLPSWLDRRASGSDRP